MSYLDDLTGELDTQLADADRALRRRFPGDRGRRQHVHTGYVPADRYAADTVQAWRAQGREVLAQHAGTATEPADALNVGPGVAGDVYLRIDFEDGFGPRPAGPPLEVGCSPPKRGA